MESYPEPLTPRTWGRSIHIQYHYGPRKVTSEGDNMSSIKTYTGVMFDPVKPNPDLIDIVDIAHALSMLCRANGHFRRSILLDSTASTV